MVELVRSWIALRDFAHFAHINVQGGHFLRYISSSRSYMKEP